MAAGVGGLPRGSELQLQPRAPRGCPGSQRPRDPAGSSPAQADKQNGRAGAGWSAAGLAAPRPADQVHSHLDTRHGEGLGRLQLRGVQEGRRPLGPLVTGQERLHPPVRGPGEPECRPTLMLPRGGAPTCTGSTADRPGCFPLSRGHGCKVRQLRASLCSGQLAAAVRVPLGSPSAFQPSLCQESGNAAQ